MKDNNFKNPHTRHHYITTLEGTNNLMFMHATTAKDNDKKFIFSKEALELLKWNKSIKTMYDYRISFGNGDVYERLFQLCVISLCSDIELFLKKTFEVFGYKKGPGKGFYQRFDETIIALTSTGHDFSSLKEELNSIKLAFQVRHICIHNYGIIDEDFKRNTKIGEIGQTYNIRQEQYREMYDAYIAFLRHLDDHLPLKPVNP